MAFLKPLVNSWDVFDTLLTRFVLEPTQVFGFIDQRHPGQNFARRRMEAQAALDRIGSPYVIYDIYRQMTEAGLATEVAARLLAEEIATEKMLMLPVRAAVERVFPNDLIVSDMYLPGEVISAMLAEVCNLHCALPVIRSNWGKATGTIWPKILEHYVIRTHHGDNTAADGTMPRQFGISTVLLRDVALNEWEKTLLRLGLGQLALIQRESRLRSLRHNAGTYEKLAAGPYLGLLLGYCGHLAQRFGESAAFAFLSRDCDDLSRIFHTTFPSIRFCNIDLSRRLIRNPENDVTFAEALPAACVLVDGVSTGRSVSALLGRLGRSGQAFHALLFLDHLLETAPPVAPSSVFKSSDFGNRHYPLELLLQSPYPPVTAITGDPPSGGLIKNFGQPELTAAELQVIGAKCETVTEFISSLRLRGLPRLTEAQNRGLMEAGLEAILKADLEPLSFPSFAAREMFSPF